LSGLVPVSPEEDTDAQDKIGADTVRGAKELIERWDVRLYLALDEASNLLRLDKMPFFGAGKLVELLSVVSYLRSADFVPPQRIYNLRGTAEPIAFIKDGQKRFLWVQPTRLKGRSGWGGRPDLLVTSARECTVTANDFVIECKHVANLRSAAIRAEFGKGFDLGVKKYLIWSFYKPSPEMVAGAAAIGIDPSGVGFDTAARTHDVAPAQLLDLFTAMPDKADRDNAFAKALQRSTLELEQKTGLSERLA
jgi:hypothetical protein